MEHIEKTTLVIMAAGIGSRFGAGIKQLASFGINGELIIDFSIYDAMEAGFNKVVFIIRKDIEADFKELIGDRISKIVEVVYVYQELSDLPMGFELPKERAKPWGTGHAVLACKGVVNEPFAVINADDYYGKEAFRKAFAYLNGKRPYDDKLCLCMVSFTLHKTLSDNGSVTRGICSFDDSGKLAAVIETYKIERSGGCAVSGDTGERIALDSRASMNFWGFYPDIFPLLEAGFVQFLENLGDVQKQEYLLPTIVDGLLQRDAAEVSVLRSDDEWFGVTYKDDIPKVRASIGRLVSEGVYPKKLF